MQTSAVRTWIWAETSSTRPILRGRRRKQAAFMRRRALLTIPVISLAAVALAGCGGSASSAAAPGGQPTFARASEGTVIRLEANPNGKLGFDRSKLEAPAGNVTIVLTNRSPLPHDVAIEGNGVDVAGNIAENGGASTVTAVLKPGTYTVLSTVEGHVEAGMEGTLTVR